MNSKRIGTFKEFLKEKRTQALNEANVSIECEWWEECIVEVMQKLDKDGQGYLIWDKLIKYCKEKWAILGRMLPQPESDFSLLTAHIKDLIFQFHGNSLYADFSYGDTFDNTQVHSKGIVIEELASVILDKVADKCEVDDELNEPTGRLMTPRIHNRKTTSHTDLPFEHRVKKFKEFINEVSKI